MHIVRLTLLTLVVSFGLQVHAQEKPAVPPSTTEGTPIIEGNTQGNWQEGEEVTPPEKIEAAPAPLPGQPQEPLSFVEQMPVFPGGEQALMTYLSKNIKYPAECAEAEVEGKVFLAFVVDREGVVTEVKVMRGVSACMALEREAVRVVRTMPKWTPGRQNGATVPVRMTIPVMFKLNL